MQAVLEIRNLCKTFTLHEQGATLSSCRDINLDVFSGQLTAVTGATGSGKSSVLRCVYRSYLPTSGSVRFLRADGQTVDLVQADESVILNLRRSEIAFVTQFLRCLPRRPALQLVMDTLIQRGVTTEQARPAAEELLNVLGIRSSLWNVPPATFSGGEKQRINLARSLIVKPRLLLLDEPTASLDLATAQRVIELLKLLKEDGVGMLAVFHDPRLVKELADHHVHLDIPLTFASDSQPRSAADARLHVEPAA